jgi:hypothetical protein
VVWFNVNKTLKSDKKLLNCSKAQRTEDLTTQNLSRICNLEQSCCKKQKKISPNQETIGCTEVENWHFLSGGGLTSSWIQGDHRMREKTGQKWPFFTSVGFEDFSLMAPNWLQLIQIGAVFSSRVFGKCLTKTFRVLCLPIKMMNNSVKFLHYSASYFVALLDIFFRGRP